MNRVAAFWDACFENSDLPEEKQLIVGSIDKDEVESFDSH